jgi:hypothetical protein
MKNSILYSLVASCLVLSCLAEADNAVTVKLDLSQPKGTISNNLLGAHFVYCLEKDAIYEDGRIADWMKNAGVGVIRWPGGTVVKFYNWENPTGVFRGDRRTPEFDPADQAPAADFMDIDEYMALVKRVGCEPMVGINIYYGHTKNQRKEGVDNALALMKHCRKKGYQVKWWYLGNEELKGEKLAQEAKRYAVAMKAFDPNIKIMINDNHVNPNDVKTYISVMGDSLDMIETHGKWKAFQDLGTYKTWQNEYPLVCKGRGIWSQRIGPLRKAAVDAGRPDMLFANNEWGLGQKLLGFDKYTTSLVLTDYLLDLFVGGWDMACLWNTQWPGRADKMLFDSTDGYSPNPITLAYELLTPALGAEMFEITSDDRLVYGFACHENERVHIYLMNKNESPKHVTVEIAGRGGLQLSALSANTLKRPGRELVESSVHIRGTGMSVALPPLSLTRISCCKQANKAIERSHHGTKPLRHSTKDSSDIKLK